MDSNIQIIEKPDWVSWDDIHNVIWKAHEKNREKGVFMRYPSLSGDEIMERIKGKGKMFVVVCEGKMVGTGAVVIKNESLWCGNGEYAYYCFASVLSEYQGKGIYRELCQRREQEVRSMGVSRILMDTNENNQRELDVAKKNYYKAVGMKYYKDHYNVVMVKWPDGCPYSDFRCKYEFSKQKLLIKAKSSLKQILGKK